jgi:hypothetical protein
MKKEVIEIGRIAAKTAIIRVISAKLPILGEVLTSVWSDIEALQAKRKQERLEEFYISLKDEVENIKEQINSSYVNQTDFLDIFELTAKYIVNERTEEKRILFKNILINSIIENDCSYDKTEKYLRILEPMNSLELRILRVLRNPAQFNEEQGEIIKDPNWISPGVRNGFQFSMTYKFLETLSKLITVSEEDTAEAMFFLESSRLVMEKTIGSSTQTKAHPIHTLDNMLTSKGKDFISFILR